MPQKNGLDAAQFILRRSGPSPGPEPEYEYTCDKVVIQKPATADNVGDGKPSSARQCLATWHGLDGPLYGSKGYPDFMHRYLDTILSIDDRLGEIYETLRASGELENTVFVHAADHGFLIGEHGRVADKREITLSRLLKHLPKGISLVRMYYNELVPAIRLDHRSPEHLAKMVLSHKSYKWLYEREWRMFARIGKARYREHSCVTRMYLGSRVGENSRTKFLNAMTPLGIKIYEMTVHKYAINFEACR